jgi:hypothetical protein
MAKRNFAFYTISKEITLKDAMLIDYNKVTPAIVDNAKLTDMRLQSRINLKSYHERWKSVRAVTTFMVTRLGITKIIGVSHCMFRAEFCTKT